MSHQLLIGLIVLGISGWGGMFMLVLEAIDYWRKHRKRR